MTYKPTYSFDKTPTRDSQILNGLLRNAEQKKMTIQGVREQTPIYYALPAKEIFSGGFLICTLLGVYFFRSLTSSSVKSRPNQLEIDVEDANKKEKI